MYRFFMRTLGVLLLLVLGLGLFLRFGPRQTVDLDILRAAFTGSEETAVKEFLEGETGFSDIKVGQEKQIIWFEGRNEKTELAIVYIHGFSASLQEIRPVPDIVASALGANLVFTRLTGHGRPGTAMGHTHVNDWIADFGEAIRVANAVGRKVVIMASSTGGTLATTVLQDAKVAENVAGLILVSPNFAVNNAAAKLGNLPMFKVWGPMIAGETRSWEPKNEANAEFWTTSYPTKSVVPMMALIAHVEKIDVSKTQIPAFFVYSDADQVVLPEATKAVADKWGGPKSRFAPNLTNKDDPFAHVIAGEIVSPTQTEPTANAMIEWIRGLQ